MEWYYIALICLGGVIALLFVFALLVYRVAFGSRCEKNPLLKYFTAEDFALTAQPVEIKKGKITLRGSVYTKQGAEQKSVLAVFCHGMGSGHCAYMTEINFLCESGFTVLALDNRGCDLSGGKSIKGMYTGVEAAKAAIDYAKSQEQFAGYKICLIGHSWGGYSALCASKERKVDAVVAISAPVSPVKTIYYGASQKMPKLLAAILCPFIAVVDFLHFGTKSNINAAKCASRSGTPTLLIQGDKDTIVPINKSAYAHATGNNIEKYMAADKSHNPYNTVMAQQMIIELSANLSKVRKMTDEQKKYFSEFDFVAATEEDEAVMGKAVAFMQGK